MPYEPKPFVNDKTAPLVRRVISRIVYAIKAARGPMETPRQRFMAHFESLFVDDTLLSLVFFNAGRVSPKMTRSAQPHWLQVKRLAQKGVKTIINVRGERDCASFYLEEETCKKEGIRLVNFQMESRRPPRLEILEQLESLFASIDYPAHIHCKAGADRAGIMSALYLLVGEKKSVSEAKKQLSLRYLHIRQSKTGVLDMFLDTYQKAKETRGLDFMTWARTEYDRDAMTKEHRASCFIEWIYTKALRRE